MATITDNDLKMFQERARTEFASRCDTGGIAWDSVIWDLCNEVRRLRGVSKESGDAAKLREAVVLALSLLDLEEGVPSKTVSQKDIDFMKAALAAPPRNCERFQTVKQAKEAYCAEVRRVFVWDGCQTERLVDWLLAPATEKEGGDK